MDNFSHMSTKRLTFINIELFNTLNSLRGLQYMIGLLNILIPWRISGTSVHYKHYYRSHDRKTRQYFSMCYCVITVITTSVRFEAV